jgi:hypothetical protein
MWVVTLDGSVDAHGMGFNDTYIRGYVAAPELRLIAWGSVDRR